ncbi:MAG: hypothetical protein LBC83_03195 [Oscillospiraceae bacterium]|jgi:hypothetical protein|nr:hypothetical protein [Oscillospiraceae bacterium]
MGMKKRGTQQTDLAALARQDEEDQKLHAVEQERERIRSLAEQRSQNERSIMERLVETDDQPRALAGLQETALGVNEWYLRYMAVEKLGRQILLEGEYKQEELQAWLAPFALSDANSFVRRAAIKHLTDLSALAKASSADAEPCVRKRAILRLFDFIGDAAALEALNRVALHDAEAELRLMAVENIVDQAALATVAKTDTEAHLRCAATRKLTGQDDLAWVLLNDQIMQVRSAAAERMTDVNALVKTAAAISRPKAEAKPSQKVAQKDKEASATAKKDEAAANA